MNKGKTMKRKAWLKKATAWAVTLGLMAGFVIPKTLEEAPVVQAADAYAGRVDASTLPREAQSWGNAPKNDEDAKLLGFTGKKEEWIPDRNEKMHFYVRYTEIVPKGDVPKSKKTIYYVKDDGTFIDPNKAPTMRSPLRPLPVFWFGDTALPTPAYTFTDDTLKYEYLPRNGYANVVVFYGRERGNVSAGSPILDMSDTYFYCINPNSVDPFKNAIYVQEPTKFTAQTNFRDLTEFPYIMEVVMKNTGLDKRSGNKPDFYKALSNIFDDYNLIVSGKGSRDQASTFDPRLTLGEVKEQFDKIWLSKERAPFAIVDGEKILPQKDRSEDRFFWIDIKKFWSSDIDDTLALGLEYVFNHYAQGFPLGGIDRFIGLKGFWGTEAPDRTLGARATARIVASYVEAARKKGFLDPLHSSSLNREDEMIAAKVVNVEPKDMADKTYKVTVQLNYTDNRFSNVSGTPPLMALLTKQGLTSDDAQMFYDEGCTEPVEYAGFYNLNPEKVKEHNKKVYLILKDPKEGDIGISFVKNYMKDFYGRTWIDKSNFEFDEESGHWLSLDYRAYHPTYKDYSMWGMTRGQQVLHFARNMSYVAASANLFFVDTRVQTKAIVYEAAGDGKGNKVSEGGSDKIQTVYPGEYYIADRLSSNTFKPGKEYVVRTTLKQKAGLEKDDKTIATVTQKFTAPDTPDAEGNYVTEIGVGKFKLEPGQTYVLFEEVGLVDDWNTTDPDSDKWVVPENKKNLIITHNDRDDKAQSITAIDRSFATTLSVTTTVNGKEEQFDSTPTANIQLSLDSIDAQNKKVKLTDKLSFSNVRPDTYVAKTELVDKNNNTVLTTVNNTFTVTSMNLAEVSFPVGTNPDGQGLNTLKSEEKALDLPVGVYAIRTTIAQRDQWQGSRTGWELRPGATPIVHNQDLNDPAEMLEITPASVFKTRVLVKKTGDGETWVEHDGDKTIRFVLEEGQENLGLKIGDEILYKDWKAGTYFVESKLWRKVNKKDNITDPDAVQVGAAVYSKIEVDPTADPEDTSDKDNPGYRIHRLEDLFTQTLEPGEYVLTQKVAYQPEGDAPVVTDPEGETWDFTDAAVIMAHENYADTNQSFRIDKQPKLSTKVTANGVEATNAQPAQIYLSKEGETKVKVSITDKLTYSHLEPNKNYFVEGVLYLKDDLTNVSEGEEPYPKKKEQVQQTIQISPSGEGFVELPFGEIELEVDKTYVVYVKLIPVELLELDANQNYILKPNLTEAEQKTILKLFNKEDKQESIHVRNEVQNGIKTRLVVLENKPDSTILTEAKLDPAPTAAELNIEPGVGKVVAQLQDEITLDESMPANQDYAIRAHLYEKAANGQIVEIFPIVSPYTQGGRNYELLADKISPYTLKMGTFELYPDKTYFVTIECYTFAHNTDVPLKWDELVKNDFTRQYFIHDGKDDLAETLLTHTSKHLSTTAKLGDADAATDESPSTVQLDSNFTGEKQQGNVVDTVTYYGLEKGQQYVLHGYLVYLNDKKEVTKLEGSDNYKEFTAEETTSTQGKEVEMTWENISLEVGVPYTVYERVALLTDCTKNGDNDYTFPTDENEIVKHEDPDATVQTVLYRKPASISTTVQAVLDDQRVSGAENKEATLLYSGDKETVEIDVSDYMSYTNLTPGAKYIVQARLMEKSADGTTEPKQVDDPVDKEFTAAPSGSGIVMIPFGKKALKPNTNYVVFEKVAPLDQWKDPVAPAKYRTLVDDPKDVLTHENAEDKAQTVVVKKPDTPDLKTNVSVEKGDTYTTTPATEPTAGATAPGTPLTLKINEDVFGDSVEATVTDTLTYTNLVPNTEYSYKAKLSEVVGDALADKPVAETEGVFTSTDDGSNVGDTGSEVKYTFEKAKLTKGKTYVVTVDIIRSIDIKNGEWPTDNVIKHNEVGDINQQIKVEKHSNPALRTVVKIGEFEAASDHALVVTEGEYNVVDTVEYSDLTPNQTYRIEGRLMKKPVASEADEPVTTPVQMEITPQTSDGSVALTFSNVKLEPNAEYVVFEFAAPVGEENWSEKPAGSNPAYELKPNAPSVIKHANPEDPAQTIVVTKSGKIGTTVSVNGKSSTAESAIEVASGTYDVTDTVTYSEFKPATDYIIQGTLRKKTADGTGVTSEVVAGPTYVTMTTPAATNGAETVSGQATLTFYGVKLEPGAEYVVYEVAAPYSQWDTKLASQGKYSLIPNAQHVSRHENPADKAQTLVVKPELKTVVQAGGLTAAEDHAVEVAPGKYAVVDTVSFKGLTVGQKYRIEGCLMKKAGDSVDPTPVAGPVQETFRAEQADMEFSMTFPKVELEANAEYVVFEVAAPVGDENWEKQPAGTTPAFKLKKDAPGAIRHEDPSDKAQTIVPKEGPHIGTTVSIGGNASTAAQAIEVAAGTYKVKDTVRYQNFTPGKKYIFRGTLMKKSADGTTDPTPVGEPVWLETEITKPNGKVHLIFENVELAAGEEYVVYEVAAPADQWKKDQPKPGQYEPVENPKDLVKHENPKDLAQTVVVKKPEGLKPSIGTTVSIGDNRSTSEKPITVKAGEHTVVDIVEYKNFKPGTEYIFRGTLMKKKPNGKVERNPAAGPVWATIITDAALPGEDTVSGTAEIRFENVMLEANVEYVVYEVAAPSDQWIKDKPKPGQYKPVENAPDLVKHEDPSDKAQTLVVEQPEPGKPYIKTTVSVDGKKATPNKALEIAAGIYDVTDTVTYTNLEPGKVYRLQGTLMLIEGDKATPVKGPKSMTFTPKKKDGKVQMIFNHVKLETGKKYVVFEVVAPNGPDFWETYEKPNGKKGYTPKDVPGVIRHEDKNDKAQTIVPKEPEETTTTSTRPTKPTWPTEPTKPTKPTTPGTTPVTTPPTKPTTPTTGPTIPKTGEHGAATQLPAMALLILLGMGAGAWYVFRKERHE